MPVRSAASCVRLRGRAALSSVLFLTVAFHLAGTPTHAAEAPPPVPPAERRAELERLIQQLRSEKWGEREEAMQALRGRTAEAAPLLAALKVADDPDLAWRVRQLKAQAGLGGLTAGQEDLAELIAMYPRLPAERRAVMLSRAVEIGGARCRSWLTELLESETNPEAQLVIVANLGWMEGGPEVTQALRRFYDRATGAPRAAALNALADHDHAEALRLAREALKSGPEESQDGAPQVLARLEDRESLPALRALAANGKTPVDLRLQALKALAEFLDQESGPIFLAALKDPNPQVYATVLAGLPGLHPDGVVPALIAAFMDGTKKEVRGTTIRMMGVLGDAEFIPVLSEALKQDAPENQKALVIEALGRLHAKEAAPAIAACLNDKSEEVRRQAIKAVGTLGWREAIPMLQRFAAAAGGNDVVSAEALCNLGDPAGPQAFIELLDRPPNAQRRAKAQVAEWRIEAAFPRLRELAEAGDADARAALLELTGDAETFRLVLKPAVLGHLARPRDPEATTNLAFVLAQQDLYEPAAKLLEGVPQLVYLYLRLANAYQELGRYVDCEAIFEHWQNEDATYLNNRAWFYCTAYQKEYLRPAAALALARRALAADPTAAHVVDTYGWALHVCGRYDESLKELTRSLDMREPADRPGRAWERTRIARTLWALGRRDEALAQVAQALEQCGDDPKVWFEAAGFYGSAGRRDDAVDAIHQAVQRGYHHVTTLELNPEFDGLRKDPGFVYAVELARTARARLERVLAEVEAEVRRTLAAKPGADLSSNPQAQDDEGGHGVQFIPDSGDGAEIILVPAE